MNVKGLLAFSQRIRFLIISPPCVNASLFNDYYDYLSKVDTEDSLGSGGGITKGVFAPGQVLTAGVISLCVGLLLGILISLATGIMVLVLGIVGALSAYFYTGKPLELKYKGLGVPLIFFIFGPLMVIGSYYVQTQGFSVSAFIISIPVGLLTTAILHANDIRDIYHDRKAGIKTLSIIVGKNGAHIFYYGLILISYLMILVMPFLKITPFWSLICLITIPSAYECMKKLRESNGKEVVLSAFDQDTAKLGAQFGSVFILSILLSNII